MQTVFHLNASELDENFLDALKMLFRDRVITITVEAASAAHSEQYAGEEEYIENGIDETEFLMRHPANRSRLLEAIQNADAGNLITVDMEKILAGAHPSDAIIHSKPVTA